jgi:microcompartment protein CcmL/EutN
VRTTLLSVGRGVAALSFMLMCAAAPGSAEAGALDAVSSKDASAGLRTALGQGIDAAVAHLGVPDGFLTNPKVTIPLPPALEKIDRGLRLVGMGGDADALKAAMNHAAESAVAEAKPVLKQALQRMTVNDAKGILTGGDDSATQYFRRTTSESLTAKFKPIVARATAQVKLASMYDQYAGKAAQFGLVKGEDVHLNDYVTAKALDGLFSEIADEERAIRKNPLGQASSLIKRVFGAL